MASVFGSAIFAFTVKRVIARPKRRRLSRPWLVVVVVAVVMWNRRILSTSPDPGRPVQTNHIPNINPIPSRPFRI